MGTISLVVVIMLVFYTGMSQFYLKRVLGIKPRGFVTEGRKKKFFILETSVMLLIFSYIIFAHFYFGSLTLLISSPMFLLFSLMLIIQGIEERKRDKQAKKYYHEWL